MNESRSTDDHTFGDLSRLPAAVPPELAHPLTRHLLSECPVLRSESDGGYVLVSGHQNILAIMQDRETFVNGNQGVRVPHDPEGVNRPPMPPLDWNGPIQRRVREVMNPFFSPQRLARHEEGFRSIIREMIEAFAHRGECEMVGELASQFPSKILCQEILGVSSEEDLEKLRYWNYKLAYDLQTEEPAVLAEVQRQYSEWSFEHVNRRRAEPGDDVLSALIYATVDGRPLVTDLEASGAIQILVAGGFSTTSEATSNIIVRLIEDPTLEPLLRASPELIAPMIEEVLRIDPPVNTRPRRCTRDVTVAGQEIHEDDRILVNYLSANVDPEEWEDPDEFIIGRKQNRIMTFGAGPHRCIGSTMARMSLRVMVEELLAHVTNIQHADGQREHRFSNTGAWRRVDHFPVTFTALNANTRANLA